MSQANRKTKNQILQANDPSGRIVQFLIKFLSQFLPITICLRLAILFFIIADLPTKRICVLTGVSDRTVRKIKNEMESQPLYMLLSIKKGSGRKGDLVNVEDKIKEELNTNNYSSLQQIADMIWEKFKIRIRLSAVCAFLKKWNFKKLMCGSIPAKADHEKQECFYEKVLSRLMKDAKTGKKVLLFMDASHFVMGCGFLNAVYCLTRRFLLTGNGRQRYNVLGAIDFITKKVITYTNDKYTRCGKDFPLGKMVPWYPLVLLAHLGLKILTATSIH